MKKHAYLYINLYIHINSSIDGCIWPYIPIYALFWCLRNVQDLLIVHSYPGSCCMLHQANTAMAQHYQTFIQRAVAPIQLPRHGDNQLHQVPYKWLNKPNLLMCIDSISGRNILLPSWSFHRFLGKGSGRGQRQFIVLPTWADPVGHLDMLWACSNGPYLHSDISLLKKILLLPSSHHWFWELSLKRLK